MLQVEQLKNAETKIEGLTSQRDEKTEHLTAVLIEKNSLHTKIANLTEENNNRLQEQER